MAALKPTPKVATAGVSGLASGLLVFIVKTVFKVEMPEEVAIAAVGVGTRLGGYLKRDKSSPTP
jgi:hypothetical protein